MLKYLVFFIFFSISSFAQLEEVESVNVGFTGDFTLQPYVPQAHFSRTQTIYHDDITQFKGDITELRFRLIFSQGTTTPQPNENMVLRLGVTDKYEFSSGDAFISDEDLTTIAVSTNFLLESFTPYWVLTLDTPFYYDGTQNLVVDVQDLSGTASSDNLFGFRGEENFNNPPTRSRVSITQQDDVTQEFFTSTLLENSMAHIQFRGDLERCTPVFSSTISTTSTTAEIQLLENELISDYLYQVVLLDEDPEEDAFLSSEESLIQIENLNPATSYTIYVKSNCDELPYVKPNAYSFTTRSTLIVPDYFNDFEETSPDYVLFNGASLSTLASNGSGKGVLMQGKPFPETNQWNNFPDFFLNNPSFIQSINLDIDLTNETLSQPILSFDLRQEVSSRLRVMVFDYPNTNAFSTQPPLDYVYEYSSEFVGEFRTLVFDLSPFIGQKKTIRIQNVSRALSHQAHIDNLRVEENTCVAVYDAMQIETSTNQLNLTWEDSDTDEWEYFLVEHNAPPLSTYTSISESMLQISNLETATAYNLFLRKKCEFTSSPWKKFYISTDPEFLEIPYQSNFSSQVVGSEYFSIIHSPASNYLFTFSNNFVVLTQRKSLSQWQGGVSPTENQAWNDNNDFITGLKFKIDATSATSLSMNFGFRSRYFYTPLTSWFRVLINGEQVGPSYNPTTINSDPITYLDFDLSEYFGEVIDVELQQVGWDADDHTRIHNLTIIGTLGVDTEIKPTSFAIYPNPSTDVFYVTGITEKASVQIFDLKGRLVSSVSQVTNQEGISILNLSSGLYFVKITEESNTSSLQLIKK